MDGITLSCDDALAFLAKLGMGGREGQLGTDPLTFLRDLSLTYLEHMPFQTVSLVAQTSGGRHVPGLGEVVAAGTSLEGGVCLTLNTFLSLILRALGLCVHLLDGNYSSSGDDHSHVVLLIKDLRSPGDDYIMDVGCGFPFAGPVPVMDLPRTYYHSGLEYRYEWLGTNVIRCHRSGDEMLEGETPVMREDWRQVFHFSLDPVDFHYFQEPMTKIFIPEEGGCDFCTVIRIAKFVPLEKLWAMGYDFQNVGDEKRLVKREKNDGEREENLIGNDGVDCGDKLNNEGNGEVGKEKRSGDYVMVAFLNQSLLVGPMDAVVKEKVEGEKLAERILEFFPHLPKEKVHIAVQKVIANSTQKKSG